MLCPLMRVGEFPFFVALSFLLLQPAHIPTIARVAPCMHAQPSTEFFIETFNRTRHRCTHYHCSPQCTLPTR